MDMESLPRMLAMAQDKSPKWKGCFMPISQTEYFVEEKTAEEECLTGMPNVRSVSLTPTDFWVQRLRHEATHLIYLITSTMRSLMGIVSVPIYT
jgi:hypothetical protein